MASRPTERSVKKTFWLLVGLFVAPLAGALLFFQFALTGDTAKVNYGDLISPVRDVVLEHKGENPLDGKWSYVILSPQCHDACAQRLKAAETVRVLSHKERRRVQTILVSNQSVQRQFLPDNISVSKVRNLVVSAETLREWQQRFGTPTDAIFLVDPLSRAMMRYPADRQEIKAMLTDLKRLLKYSRIG